MTHKNTIYDFPHTQYRTCAEFSFDGSNDFVIVQDCDGCEACDIVIINRQDAINLAHKILDHVREVAA